MGKKKTHEEYVAEVAEVNPNIEVIGQYIDNNTKILHKCKIDGYIWEVRPYKVLGGHGCHVCTGQAIGPAPLFKNSIWASKYKEYFAQYLTEEQMKQYRPFSNKLITIPCSVCGDNINTSPYSILSNKHIASCSCNNDNLAINQELISDGISFPNKFVYNVLEQLHLSIKPEYSPKWAGRKKYDDFVVDYNIIIENHGLQHYKDVGYPFRSLKEEQENDKLKQDIAINNGINKYIILDCRISSCEWIKNSIMQSELPIIFNFSESDINWCEATRYAISNLALRSVELFNQGYVAKEISKILNRSVHSIKKWLTEARKAGLLQEPKHKDKTERLTLRVPEHIYLQLQLIAKENETSINQIINKTIIEHLITNNYNG